MVLPSLAEPRDVGQRLLDLLHQGQFAQALALGEDDPACLERFLSLNGLAKINELLATALGSRTTASDELLRLLLILPVTLDQVQQSRIFKTVNELHKTEPSPVTAQILTEWRELSKMRRTSSSTNIAAATSAVSTLNASLGPSSSLAAAAERASSPDSLAAAPSGAGDSSAFPLPGPGGLLLASEEAMAENRSRLRPGSTTAVPRSSSGTEDGSAENGGGLMPPPSKRARLAMSSDSLPEPQAVAGGRRRGSGGGILKRRLSAPEIVEQTAKDPATSTHAIDQRTMSDERIAEIHDERCRAATETVMRANQQLLKRMAAELKEKDPSSVGTGAKKSVRKLQFQEQLVHVKVFFKEDEPGVQLDENDPSIPMRLAAAASAASAAAMPPMGGVNPSLTAVSLSKRDALGELHFARNIFQSVPGMRWLPALISQPSAQAGAASHESITDAMKKSMLDRQLSLGGGSAAPEKMRRADPDESAVEATALTAGGRGSLARDLLKLDEDVPVYPCIVRGGGPLTVSSGVGLGLGMGVGSLAEGSSNPAASMMGIATPASAGLGPTADPVAALFSMIHKGPVAPAAVPTTAAAAAAATSATMGSTAGGAGSASVLMALLTNPTPAAPSSATATVTVTASSAAPGFAGAPCSSFTFLQSMMGPAASVPERGIHPVGSSLPPSLSTMMMHGSGSSSVPSQYQQQQYQQQQQPMKKIQETCRFWREGNCPKGFLCEFLHEELGREEIVRPRNGIGAAPMRRRL